MIYIVLLCITALCRGEFSAEQYSACKFALFSGKSHPGLAEAIGCELGAQLEVGAKGVENQNVYLIQPLCPSRCNSINDTLMELYTLAREVKRSSCRKVTAIISHCGDECVNMEDAAHLLESGGVDRVVCIDTTCKFKKAKVDNLSAANLLAAHFAEKKLADPVVVGEKAKAFQAGLGECGVIAQLDFVGDLSGRDLILVEDFASAEKLLEAAEKFSKLDAGRLFACVTHSSFSGSEMELLGSFNEVVVTDTLPLKGALPTNMTQVSLAPLFAEAIFRIETNRSMEDLHGD